MRVLFLLQDTGRLYGAEAATLHLLESLQQDTAVQPVVALIRETRLDYARADDLRQRLQAVGLPLVLLPTSHAFSVSLIRHIRATARQTGARVLHTTGYKADVHGWLAVRSSRPCISTIHGWLFRPELKERAYGWINLLVLRRFQRVIVLSRYYKDYMLSRGVAPERLVHIPTGLKVDPAPPALPAASEPGRPFTVGMLGRLSAEKNHRLLVEALAIVHRQHLPIHALLAGEGPEQKNIEQALEARGLTNRATLCGFIDSRDFFRRVDVLVVCSRIENLPRCIQEAMQAGIPALASRVGGIPDLVEHEKTGLLFDAHDPHELARALQRAMEHPEERRAWALAAHQKLLREFQNHTLAEQHLALYRALASGSPSRVGAG